MVNILDFIFTSVCIFNGYFKKIYVLYFEHIESKRIISLILRKKYNSQALLCLYTLININISRFFNPLSRIISYLRCYAKIRALIASAVCCLAAALAASDKISAMLLTT